MGQAWTKRVWLARHLPDTEFATEGQDTDTVNTKRLARFIKQGYLAPIWNRDDLEDPENEHECPICFHHMPTLNSSTCCNQSVCTECFLRLVKPQPGSRSSSPCPFCNKAGFHVYYSPSVLSERKQREVEEQARVSEAQLRAVLARQALEEGPEGPASDARPGVILRTSANQKPEWEEWPAEDGEAALPGTRMGEGEGQEGAGAVSLQVAAPECDTPGPAPPAHRRHRSMDAGSSGAHTLAALGRHSVGWHQLTGHGSTASLAVMGSSGALAAMGSSGAMAAMGSSGAMAAMGSTASLAVMGSTASLAAMGSSLAMAAMDSAEAASQQTSRQPSGAVLPDAAALDGLQVVQQTITVGMVLLGSEAPPVVQTSSAFDPGRGGPALVTGPDGSTLLFLLACEALPQEERAALRATAEAALAPQGLTTYNAPPSAYDDALRASIAHADALLRERAARGEGGAELPGGQEGWLERMAAADAALRSAVDTRDRAVFRQ